MADKKLPRAEERLVKQVKGTIPDDFMAPGSPEFDRASQFVEVYRTEGEVEGATETFFDLHAWVEGGEVARIDANLDYSPRGSWHTVMARDIADNILANIGVNEVRASLRAQFIKPGLVVNWDVLRQKTKLDICASLAWREGGTVVREALVTVLDEVMYHMEQEGQNNFHGFEGPKPYPTVHIVAHKVDGSVPTSYCGRGMYADVEEPVYRAHGVEEYVQPLWIPRERFEKFGPPPFSPICFDCADALAHVKHAESKGKLVIVSEGHMAELLKQEGLVPVADPDGAILGIEPADATPLEKAQVEYEFAVNKYQGRKLFFLDIAGRGPSALSEKDANEWASAMAQAELLREHASGGPGQFEVTYDDLLGVVALANKETGRFAALEPSLCDVWAKFVEGEERERVLLALVFDKYLANPDVEGQITGEVTKFECGGPEPKEVLHCEDCGGTGVHWRRPELGNVPDAYDKCEACGGSGVPARFLREGQTESLLGEQFRPTSVDEAESFFRGVAQTDIFLLFASYHWYSGGIGAEEWVTRMAIAEALASISTGFMWHEEWNAPTGQREALVEVSSRNGRRASFWVASQEVRWWEAQKEAGSRVFRAILFDKYLRNPNTDAF